MIDNDVQFSFGSNSYYLPVLIVKPIGTLGKKCCFCLRVVPEKDIYSLHKFSPSTSNINRQWYSNTNLENGNLNILYCIFKDVKCKNCLKIFR